MVVKRKWLILSVALVFTVLGGVRTLMKTPLYTATVRIQIEREPAKIVESGATNPVEAGSSDFLRTQYELLKSRAMAERVASALRLAEDDKLLEAAGCFASWHFRVLRGERSSRRLKHATPGPPVLCSKM